MQVPPPQVCMMKVRDDRRTVPLPQAPERCEDRVDVNSQELDSWGRTLSLVGLGILSHVCRQQVYHGDAVLLRVAGNPLQGVDAAKPYLHVGLAILQFGADLGDCLCETIRD